MKMKPVTIDFQLFERKCFWRMMGTALWGVFFFVAHRLGVHKLLQELWVEFEGRIGFANRPRMPSTECHSTQHSPKFYTNEAESGRYQPIDYEQSDYTQIQITLLSGVFCCNRYTVRIQILYSPLPPAPKRWAESREICWSKRRKSERTRARKLAKCRWRFHYAT
jgi:hypothetical protein